MAQKDLDAKVKALEKKISSIQDIQDIKKLQRVYGFYLDNRLWNEIVDLFSDETESLEISDSGIYLGKEGVARFFKQFLGKGGLPPFPGALGIHMQLQGVVNLKDDCQSANGRWQCVMLLATPLKETLRALLGYGVYKVGYIKESGTWKFKKMHFYLTFRTPLDEGWVKTPVMVSMANGTPDLPTTVYKPYPDKYLVPFHFTNPVTGKDVNQEYSDTVGDDNNAN